jgi:hypothetical protein
MYLALEFDLFFILHQVSMCVQRHPLAATYAVRRIPFRQSCLPPERPSASLFSIANLTY